MIDMKKIIECADCIAMCGDTFVVVERLTKLPGLAFPGGKIDGNESAEDAAKREFFEETGLSLTILGKIGRYDVSGRDARGEYASTAFVGVASGVPVAEVGKTHVLLLSREEIESRKAEFVADHYQMFTDYMKQNCS